MPARAPGQPHAITRPPASRETSAQPAPPVPEQPGTAEAPGLDSLWERANRLGHHFERLPHLARPPQQTAAPAGPSPTASHGGLPGALRNGLERLSGMNLSDVRVHYRSPEPHRMQAFASTRGNHIHLAPGQEHQLAHEGWHVVQQRQGRVRATAQLQGQALNEDSSLEREADVMGTQAASAASHAPAPAAAPAASSTPARGGTTASVSQLRPWPRFLKGLMGGYGAFMGHNAYRQLDIQRNPQKYLGPENEEKGRLRAVYETSQGKEGSSAQAMHPPVSLFHLFMGNLGSSNIGQHYAQDIPHMLQAPDSDENLHAVAEHETEKYWKHQPGLSGYMGSAIGTKTRANILKKFRDHAKGKKDEPDISDPFSG